MHIKMSLKQCCSLYYCINIMTKTIKSYVTITTGYEGRE